MKADALLAEETGKAFKKDKKSFKRRCLSVNNCICHYSPLSNDADTVLKTGDLTKIDL